MADRLQQARDAQKEGRHEQAIAIANKLNAKKKTRTVESILLEADSCIALQDTSGAESCLRKGLKDKPGKSEFILLSEKLVSVLSGSSRFSAAMGLLAKLEKLVPEVRAPEIAFQRALLYSEMRQLKRAVARCMPLLNHPRLRIPAALLLMELAVQKSDMGLFDQAVNVLRSERKALNDTNLLAVIERTSRHRPLASEEFFEEARRRDLTPHRVKLFAARKAIDARDYDRAGALVDEIDERRISVELKPLYFSVLASLNEKAADYESAFKSFQRMNQISADLLPPDWRETRFDPKHPFTEVCQNGDDYETPVPIAFIVGFPRSGTTLLQTILASQPGVEVIDEKPIIHTLKERILAESFDLADCLVKMDEGCLQSLRDAYFELATEYVSLEGTQLIVDKNPLQMIDLPLIINLFPSAKILLAIRHPLDVILSCFQQTFEANSQMAYFTDLESCFVHYRNVFQSYHGYRGRLEMQEYTVRYETLINDFESEAERMLAFLGLNSDKSALHAFSRQAQGTMINTPSSSQVRQGVYTGSIHRWENYASFLEPYIPLVQSDMVRYEYNR